MTIITHFSVPTELLDEFGLKSIEMTRLGRFVALTGKNGAGKSRVLELLVRCIQFHEQQRQNPSLFQQQIHQYQQDIANNPGHPSTSAWEQQIVDLRKQPLLAGSFGQSDSTACIKAIPFVPKQLTLQDPRQKTKGQLVGSANTAKNPGLNSYEHYCLDYIQQLQNRRHEVTHSDSNFLEIERSETQNDYSNLDNLIYKLLKTRLGRDKDGDTMLFNKPMAESRLSDGQKVLIQLAVALHAQKSTLDGSVFMMDEPENHLHPSALIECFDALTSVALNSQFWIATHSIPLLSYIAGKEPMSIWYVEEGRVSNAGSHPERVLRGLLGDEEQVERLHAFTALPAQLAAINYAAESLTVPRSVGQTSGDPQVAQIAHLVNQSAAESPIAFLDFGAGKGRLLAGLAELLVAERDSFVERCDYFAFDSSNDDREICKAAIRNVYGDDEKQRYFSSREEFFSTQDESSIDIVVMCNTLYEIDPSKWLTQFNKESLIFRALKDTGHVLIVEDQRIPVGEKAHQYGFLVLDTPHLKTLFGVLAADQANNLFVPHDHRGNGRLKAHLVSKILLERVTSETRKKAIQELCATAKTKIMELRKTESNYRNGQLHGFWTQQFANASLYLEAV